MQVIIIGKKNIYKKVLPKKPDKDEYIKDEKNNTILNIVAEDNNWVIYNAKNFNILEIDINSSLEFPEIKTKVEEKVALRAYKVYRLNYGTAKYSFLLYCLPTYEDNWKEFYLKGSHDIIIGKDFSSHICYRNAFILPNHAKIILDNGKWYIQNNNAEYPIFVSDRCVTKNNVVVNNGEVIFIMGLKIVIIGNRLFMNNPFNQVEYDENFLIRRVLEVPKLVKENLDDIEALNVQKEFFYSSPRLIRKIEKVRVKIEAPPAPQNQEQLPFLLTMGSSLTMVVMLLSSTVSMIRSIFSGNASIIDILISALYILVTILGMIIIPVITKKWEKKRAKEYEKKRQIKYKQYLDKKIRDINNIKNTQKEILEENCLSTEACIDIILNKEIKFWARTIKDDDFSTICLGRGTFPVAMEIEYPQKEFSMEEEDNLEKLVTDFTKDVKMLNDVPVGFQLNQRKMTALIANYEDTKNFMMNIVIQLMAMQNFQDLKLVFLLEDTLKLGYAKSLPYVWNDSNTLRFFAEDEIEMEQISKYLEEQFNTRLENRENRNGNNSESPFYLIITDNYRKIENLKIIAKILESDKGNGFSIFTLVNDFRDVPNECTTFISIEDGKGKFFESDLSTTQLDFEFEKCSGKSLEQIINTVSNISIKSRANEVNSLPNNYTFLDMFNAGNIEHLKIFDRWTKNDSTTSLNTPIGINGFGKLVTLDAHEKAHGPHGLIGGTTGSGKSEFIITYILSMAVNYHPDDVAFILIDYKGGGLAGAFYKDDYKLPHIVGTITNIDTVGLQRSLASINSELRRRQVLFNEARDMTSEGTIDIYKYQRLYHSGVLKRPIPHLFIVCDEFAELKQQQSEFMSELVSVSRIGRSLGVHLILATQKPGGVVDDQIRSNSKFSICLKVQDRGDSSDLLGRPDAAYLKQAGRFYIKVGNDEVFELGQSGWAGAKYYESDTTKKGFETSVKFISNLGKVIKEYDDEVKKEVVDSGEQLTNLVKYISELAENNNIKTENLWLDAIPETIYLNDIKEKYKIKPKKNNIIVTLGEYDDPENQRQDAVALNLSKVGNVIIMGSVDSGKETLASTMIYDLLKTYTPKDVWMYILDFGTEALKIYNKAPMVGDMMFINDAEKIMRFLGMLCAELNERKQILSEYNGDYQFYLKSTGESMPMIVTILNGFETFSENYNNDKIDDMLLNLTREGTKYGFVFVVVTTSNKDLRYRMNQNFKQRIALKQNDSSDYADALNINTRKRPSALFGRGLIEINESVYEFQTAKICTAEDYNILIKDEIEKLDKNVKAPAVRVLPDKLRIDDIKDKIKTISKLPVGLKKDDLTIATLNFKDSLLSAIVSKKVENAKNFAYILAEELKLIENVKVIVLNAESKVENSENSCENSLYDLLGDLNSETKDYHTICILVSIDSLLNYLGQVNQDGVTGDEFLGNLIAWAKDKKSFSFIVADSDAYIKNHNYDAWYANNVNSANNIWVGNGIDDQFVITVNANRASIVNDCDCSFGYINVKDKTMMVKLLEMKEMSESDE